MNHNHDSSISPNKASHPPRNVDLHLQSQAIMTPPPSFGSHAFHKSPFASWMDQLPSVPATDLRPQTFSIPRSHVFSSLAPLAKLSPTEESHNIDMHADQHDHHLPFGSIKRTVPLQHLQSFGSPEEHTSPLPAHAEHHIWHHRGLSNGSGSDVSSASANAGIEPNALAGPSSQPMLRARSRDSDQGSQACPLSRTLFGSSDSHQRLDDIEMDIDSDEDHLDALPPASPSPLYEQQDLLDPGSAFNLDLGEPMLQPGSRPTHRLSRKSSSSSTTHTLASSSAQSITSASQPLARQARSRQPSQTSPPLSGHPSQQLCTPARQRSATGGGMELDEPAAHSNRFGPAMGAPYTQPRAPHRTRASSSAASHRPLSEFLTPRSISASAGLGEKLPGVANLFEFATQPRPSMHAPDRDSEMRPLREARRSRPANLSTSSFPTAKLFEDEIEAVAKASAPTQTESSTVATTDMTSDQLDLVCTPARRKSAPLRGFGCEASPSYMETTPQFATPHSLFGNVLQANTPADDSGVAFGDGEQSIKSNRKRMGSALTPASKDSPMPSTSVLGNVLDDLSSPLQDALRRHETSFHRDSPAPRPVSRTIIHSFGPKERSSLMHQTRFNSSENGSANSSPDPIPRVRSRTSTSAASPARLARERRPTSESIDATSQYLTPQNFKSVKPLQAAFMSTGLVSKRNRARENSEGADGGSDALPLPPKPPNFGHALGLREVVAAATAHASATADRSTNAMPDTPVKKANSTPLVPFPKLASGLRGQMSGAHPNGLGRSPLGVNSPAKDPAVSNGVSTGSPVLPDSCDSPILNLINLGVPNASTPATLSARHGVAFGNLPCSRSSPHPDAHGFQTLNAGDSTEDDENLSDVPNSPSVQSGRIRDVNRLQKGKRTITTLSSSGTHAPCRKMLSVDTCKAAGAPKTLRVRSAGLGKRTISRNASFIRDAQAVAAAAAAAGTGTDTNGELLPPSTPLTTTMMLHPGREDLEPMTPTRNAAQIKWFEAAQVLTTPSPSTRRQNAKLRAHRLELMGPHRKSSLSETSTCQETPQKASASTADSDCTTTKHGHLETAFTVEETIGSGEFSEVVKAVSRSTGYAYAVKRMKKAYLGPRDRLRRLEEVDVLRALSRSGKSHANIVSLLGAWEEEGHLFLQLELCPLGSLAFFLEEYGQQVGALEEARLWKVLAELSSGVEYIHGHGILHLDLKPANVLITEHGTLKIGDFGMATRWPLVDAETTLRGAGLGAGLGDETGQCAGVEFGVAERGRGLEREGDRVYLAPEVIFHGEYGKAADVFSLGLIILEAAGNVELPDNGEAWQKLRRDDFSDVDLSALSGPMLRVLTRLLNSDPEERATMEEIVNLPTMTCVRAIMARGLSVSEMDQLPEFTDSSTSGSLVGLADSSSLASIQSDASTRTLGLSGSETGSSAAEFSEADSAGLGARSISNHTISTSISSFSSSTTVIRVRGALIQEPEEEFMRQVLASDPLEQGCGSKDGGRWIASASGREVLTNVEPMQGEGCGMQVDA
ncbi:hypothetical protein NDA18_004132 [Ustilago nuda]|nr:hypothetical protein NDA18_004132 [Ustilago nuda]